MAISFEGVCWTRLSFGRSVVTCLVRLVMESLVLVRGVDSCLVVGQSDSVVFDSVSMISSSVVRRFG